MAVGRAWFLFQSAKGSETTTTPAQRKRTVDSTMLFLCALLVLAGGIYSTPVPGHFSFQVSSKFQVISACYLQSAVIHCETNDPSAHVTFVKVHVGSSVANQERKITRNGATFTIHNLVLRDGGEYRCIAERNGQVIERRILLYVNTRKPAIDIIPFEAKRVVNGSTVVYTCIGTHDISWHKVGGSFPMVDVSIYPSYNNGTWRKYLVFEKTDFSHAGVYKCELDKSCYSNAPLWKSVELRVSAPKAAQIRDVMVVCNIAGSPIPKTWRKDGKLIENSHVHVHDICGKSQILDVKFVCNIAGFPKPKITWKKDGKLIEKSNKYLLTPDSLKIVRLSFPGDDGVFSCEAKNAYGVDHKSFDILPAPPVLDKSQTTTFTWKTGQSKRVRIPCVLKAGIPDTTLKWEYQLCPKSYPCITIPKNGAFEVDNERSKSTLIVSFVYWPAVEYFNFICKANNTEGEDQIMFQLYKPK